MYVLFNETTSSTRSNSNDMVLAGQFGIALMSPPNASCSEEVVPHHTSHGNFVGDHRTGGHPYEVGKVHPSPSLLTINLRKK